MWCCLSDPTFSRFSRTPTCEGQTDGQTDGRTDAHRSMASTANAQHRAVKRCSRHSTPEPQYKSPARTATVVRQVKVYVYINYLNEQQQSRTSSQDRSRQNSTVHKREHNTGAVSTGAMGGGGWAPTLPKTCQYYRPLIGV